MRAAEGASELSMAPILRQMMEGLLHLSDRCYAEAEGMLRQAVVLQHEARYSAFFGNASLLLAYLYLLWKRPDDALVRLEPALAENEQQGTPGFILWEGIVMVPLLRLAIERRVCAAFAAHALDLFRSTDGAGPTHVPETGRVFTSREAEILRLVAEGLTDEEVAVRLHISPRTVSQHLRSIYRKLDVPSWTAATHLAIERELI